MGVTVAALDIAVIVTAAIRLLFLSVLLFGMLWMLLLLLPLLL